MSKGLLELLTVLGYPIVFTTLLIFAYFFRKSFENFLKSIVEKDLEKLRQKNRIAIEEIQQKYRVHLESKRHELINLTERLKASIAVETETYRLAAQKRFDILISLWESSESLFEKTDFSDEASIKASLEQLDNAMQQLNRYTVLLSKSTVKEVRLYFETLINIITTPDEEYEKKAYKNTTPAGLMKIFSDGLGIFLPGFSLITTLGSIIVTSLTKKLTGSKAEDAHLARMRLEGVIRKEFGITIPAYLSDENGA